MSQALRQEGDDAPGLEASSEEAEAAAGTSRRTFLGNVGKRAAFVVPIVMTLTAEQARAAPSCAPNGAACTSDSDCCSNKCTAMSCEGS
jgi:hypothetical protein